MRGVHLVLLLSSVACDPVGIPQTPPPGSAGLLIELEQGLEACRDKLKTISSREATKAQCREVVIKFDREPDSTTLALCNRHTMVKLELSLGATLNSLEGKQEATAQKIEQSLELITKCRSSLTRSE